jgi:hypothetical protein
VPATAAVPEPAEPAAPPAPDAAPATPASPDGAADGGGDEAAPPGLAPARRQKPARAQRPARAARPKSSAASGKLDVTAPPDAEVFLDGRRVGRGNVRMSVAEGPHRIEVRRGGASATEQFTLEPGETWTYTVTPTP